MAYTGLHPCTDASAVLRDCPNIRDEHQSPLLHPFPQFIIPPQLLNPPFTPHRGSQGLPQQDGYKKTVIGRVFISSHFFKTSRVSSHLKIAKISIANRKYAPIFIKPLKKRISAHINQNLGRFEKHFFHIYGSHDMAQYVCVKMCQMFMYYKIYYFLNHCADLKQQRNAVVYQDLQADMR